MFGELRQSIVSKPGSLVIGATFDTLWPSFSDVPSPSAKHFHHLGGHGGGEGDPDEDEAFVNGIGQGQLCP